MKIVLAIVRRFLLALIRNRANLGFMVVLPVVFTLVFGVIPTLSSNKTPIDVVNADSSQVSQAVLKHIKATPNIEAHTVSAATAKSDLRNMRASLIITLPKGMEKAAVSGKKVPLGWEKSPNAGDSSTMTVMSTLETNLRNWVLAGGAAVQTAKAKGVSNTHQLALAFTTGMQGANQIQNLVQTHSVDLSHGKVVQHTLGNAQKVTIGFATMFIIFTVFGTTSTVFREKVTGTWSRFKASPVSRTQILAGYGIGFFIVGWIQFLIMDVAGLVMFGHGIPMTGWTVAIMSFYVLAIVGIALCIAGVVKTIEQHMTIGSFIAIATSMLGGAYWPLDLEPNWMQKVALFVPQSWAMDAFKAVSVGAVSVSTLAVPLAVLGGFAIIFFSAGMVQLRYS
ncbi:ABC transporter permease [Alicyclobacillus sp. SO9]|uniref:ABC transporter permease n=1 Tax=Alicyclobacillus sp. SO9 TaxID=2665646 RepID=UPI0018E8D422|nr:ABC transporter permease [Alicyclobacillus sp. SO9]QQE78582.1 ABC transporter permease [Alicyclobacillus sp. SO9]